MKLGKIDFCKIKKITAIEIITVVLALIAFGIYYSPNFMHKQEVLKAAKAKANNAIFTSKIIEEFAHNKNIKPSEVAKIVIEELNKTTVNPYNKNEKYFVLGSECKGSSCIETDDNIDMVIITTYNKKGVLQARTVIKPPSFVVYNKEEHNKTNK